MIFKYITFENQLMCVELFIYKVVLNKSDEHPAMLWYFSNPPSLT